MKTIPLTQGQLAIVDDEDYEKVANIRWWAHWDDTTQTYKARGRVNGKLTYMHRFILDAPDNKLVDHANHNGLENVRENIRLCTKQQNCANSRKKRKNLSSKYKGVYKYGSRWRARIKVNKKLIFLGLFKKEIDAAVAYDIAAKKYFGEFACLNFSERTVKNNGPVCKFV